MKVTLVRSRAIDPAINKVANALSKKGYDVKLLVWDRNGNKQVENSDGVIIHRFGFRAPHDKPKVMFYLPIWWMYEFLFLIKDDAAIMHVCDLDTLIPAIFVKLIKKNKLCYTIYDFYAGNLSNKFPYRFRKFVAFMELFGIRFTDVLFLVDECRYEQVKGAKITDVAYIYNSPPEYYFSVKNRHNPNNEAELNLFYAGIIHKSRGLEYMIKAISDINCRMTIAGIGDIEDLLKNIPIDVKNKIMYIGQISYEKVIEKSMESDVLFAFYEPITPNNRYASPNKLFEAMMCGKPIIINSGIAASKIVLEERCGIVVPYGDIDEIRDAIIMLRDDPNLRKTFGENGRRAYEKRYSWELMESRLINAYRKLEDSNLTKSLR